MAEFRRCLYALAFVALLAGLTVPASAQMQCSTNSVPPIVRAEGYAELTGDIIIDCTGGTPTAPGLEVPRVQIAVNLDTFVSSKVTAVVNSTTEFLESLLIVDEPNSLTNQFPAAWVGGPVGNLLGPRPIRNCGAAHEDTTAAGAGTCVILGVGSNDTASNYNGQCAQPVVNAANYNCHPNVFQGRSLVLVTSQTNQVLFADIPVDPPGTLCPASDPGYTHAVTIQVPCHRIIRITNIRGDASQTGVAQGNQTSSINAQIIANPPNGLPVGDPTRVVARVQLGLVTPALTNTALSPVGQGGKFDFVQCTILQNQNQGMTFTFREAFINAFKPRSLTQTLNNGATGPYAYAGNGSLNVSTLVTLNQNVPGTTYDSESGFVNSNPAANGNNPNNPLNLGVGTGAPFVDTNNAVNSTTTITSIGNVPVGTGSGTGWGLVGIATQGTRLIANFANVPTGVTISVPNIVNLVNVISGVQTGVAVLVTGTNAAGAGYPFGGLSASGSTNVAGSQIPGSTLPLAQRAVYEIFFSNPGALEQMSVPLAVLSTCALGSLTTPCPNLPGNIPPPNTIATIQGGFAPFYAPSQPVRTAALEPLGLTLVESSASSNFGPVAGSGPAILPVPRFQNLNAPVNLLSVTRCSCNLLFPFVTNAPTAGGNFDTGMAIANTSLDPGNLPPNTYGFKAGAQSGPVQLWFYNRNASPAAEPNFLNQGNTQCTNATTPGSCSGTLTSVAPGGMLTYVVSSGGAINGGPAGPVLLPATITGGFTGYVIAQAGFQFCHGFAFISKQGAGFEADNMAMGYLALVLDSPSAGIRTNNFGENDAH